MGKLSGFSLFESVIAVTIIAILICIATMVYGNVMDSEKPLAYYQGKANIALLLNQLKTERNYTSLTEDYGIYSIQQEIKPHKGNQNLFAVEYQLRAGTKIWWKEKHLICNEL